MTWFKVDDGLAFHTKTIRAGNPAMGLWVRAGAWCSQHLTDGMIPTDVALTMGTQEDADRLVKVGLWEVADDESYRFHDWFDSNPSRAEVEAARKRERDKKAHARARRAADMQLSLTDDCDDPEDTPEDNPGPVPEGVQGDVPRGQEEGPPEGVHEVIPEVGRSTRPVPSRPINPPTPPAGATGTPPSKRSTSSRRKPSRPFPEDFTITEAMRHWHRGKGVSDTDANYQTERLRRWALAGDRRYVEWEQVWRNWIDGALERGHIRPRTNQPVAAGAGSGIKPWM